MHSYRPAPLLLPEGSATAIRHAADYWQIPTAPLWGIVAAVGMRDLLNELERAFRSVSADDRLMKAPAWFRHSYPVPAVPETVHPRMLLPDYMTEQGSATVAAICKAHRSVVWSTAIVVGWRAVDTYWREHEPCYAAYVDQPDRPQPTITSVNGLLQQFGLLNPIAKDDP